MDVLREWADGGIKWRIVEEATTEAPVLALERLVTDRFAGSELGWPLSYWWRLDCRSFTAALDELQAIAAQHVDRERQAAEVQALMKSAAEDELPPPEGERYEKAL